MEQFSGATGVKFSHLFQMLAYSYPFNNFILYKDLDGESVFINKEDNDIDNGVHQVPNMCTSSVYYHGVINKN